MIDLYTWTTPNGRKVSVMLEECALPYTVHAVNIGQNEQYAPEFVAINPNSKIPVIIDRDGPDGATYRLFESGAILLYLAEKTGRFLPQAIGPRYQVIQWLMFQMGGVGPMFGQAHHFLRAAPEAVPYAVERYTKEVQRLYGVLDAHLSTSEFLAGDYSVADIATFPWIARHDWHKVDLDHYPNVKRWHDGIAARPAVQKGMAVPG